MKTLSTPTLPNHSFTMQLTYPNQIGMFARIAETIGRHGGGLGDIEMLGPGAKLMTHGISVRARDDEHVEEIVAAVRNLGMVRVVEVSDPVFRMHQGGKIAVQSKIPILSRESLSMAYTPGVAR